MPSINGVSLAASDFDDSLVDTIAKNLAMTAVVICSVDCTKEDLIELLRVEAQDYIRMIQSDDE